MNWMHAFFGLGVALGPLIMTGALSAGLSWRWGYGLVAAAQLALAAAFALTVRAWRDRAPAREPAGSAPGSATAAPPTAVPVRETLRLPAVWLGAAAFAVYVAIEVAAGLWAFLLLTEGRGLGAAVAGVCVSGYWGSLFVGRVVQGVVAERLGAAVVLRGSLAGMAVGAVLIALPGTGLGRRGRAVRRRLRRRPGLPAAHPHHRRAGRCGARGPDHRPPDRRGRAGSARWCRPGIGVLLGNTSVELLGPALVVLALGLIALHAAGTRRPAPAPR